MFQTTRNARPTTANPPSPSEVLRDPELTERLARANPGDTARGLFFNGALAVIRDLGGKEAVELCRTVTGEKSFIDFFNYSIAGFLQMCWVASHQVGEKLGGPDAFMRAIGKRAVDDFLSSASGKTLLLLAGSSPERMVSNLPSGYKACVSYGERTVRWAGDKHAILTMKGDFPPVAYQEGVLLSVVSSLGGKNARVTGKRTGVIDAEYDLQWD